MKRMRRPKPGEVQCPASMDWTTPETAYIAQSRDLRYFCCSEACARHIADGEPGPWVILPPSPWVLLSSADLNRGMEADTSGWQPIVLEGVTI
jgi:hypothetical protein